MSCTISENSYLLSEWDFEKNEKLKYDPYVMTTGSGMKVWWRCPHGHSYEMAIEKRSKRGNGCPYCSGHRFLAGYNDFKTKFPQVAEEWDYDKNGGILPSQIPYRSPEKYWWKCPLGHSYRATARDRGVGHTNCPICNRRKQTSFPEQALYFYIKKVYPDAINSYKDIFNNGMEIDIYIPKIKYGIEYDGKFFHQSEKQLHREEIKYQICKSHGIRLVRVKEGKWTVSNCISSDFEFNIENPKNDKELTATFQRILDRIDPASNQFTRKNPFHYLSDTKVDIARDRNEILKSYMTVIPNSLKTIRPDVAKLWNFEKNSPLLPAMFAVHSNEMVWWKCDICGHEWRSQINSMTREGRKGCPVCAKAIRGKTQTKNALATRSLVAARPAVLEEFDTERNIILPNEITVGSAKPVWWKCKVCGYRWKTSPCNRISKGCGCPHCSGRVAMPGIDDLKTVYPQIVADWDYEKNAFSPSDVLPRSGKKAHWKCQKCGHRWEAVIRDRTNGSRCPICKNVLVPHNVRGKN